jgi:hypothetical protein
MSATIEMYRGDNHDVNVVVKDSAGVPVDITGARIKSTIDALPSQVFKDSDNGSSEIELTIPASGEFQIKIVPADTENMEVGTYQYDIEIELNGKKTTLVVDFFKVKADITP